ncbi:MAG: DNA translocase FtsK, partial [Planctomycetota bacterium]
EKIESLPVFFGSANKQKAEETDLETLRAARMSEEETDRNYVFPGLDLLEDPEEDFNDKLEAYVRDQAEALEHALRQYRIKGEVVGIESGPVITLYQVRLAPGTKVSTITAVDKDIARSLRAVNIRIVANTEGLDTVGIEVPNQTKEKVRLKELMSSSDAVAKMRLPMFLGKDASGRPLVSDLAKLPHMLIAGTTGSGKSVCMNTIIMGFLYTQKPTDLKMVLVDPKMVEMSQFKDIPHLLCPVVTEMSKAAAILEWAVQKMDERYELLAEAGCRDISAYNSLTWEELLEIFEPGSELEEAKIPRKLPYMVFVIDELADLMMTNKEVEGSIVRIAQKARAVGIHLILATQRPQANVVTGLIKSNMPGRVSFKVASGMDSRIVMDQKGGELLLGQGDMLMITPRSSQAMRAQGTLVDDAEIRRVVKFVKEHSTANFSRELVALKDSGFDDSDPYSADAHEEKMRQSAQEDPLFDRAVEIVLETRRGSVSLLQRRLAIGYTRASRLIEMMGFCGIIGKHKGSVAREVQMTVEQWEAIKARAAEETEDVEKTPLFDASKQEDALDETHDSASAIAEAKPSIIEGGEEHADDIEDVPFDVEEEEAGVAVHANRIADEESDTDEDEYEEEGEGDEEFVDELEEAEEVEDEEEHGDEEPTLIDEESQEADDSEEESDEEEEDWEYEYVDEDGNPIDAEELEEEGDEDWEYEESEEVDEAEERA